MYLILSLLCMILLCGILIGFLVAFWRRDRGGKIAFVRDFKKGSCAIIYLAAIPIYCIGHLHAGQNFLDAFFLAINKVANLVALRYDSSTVRGLMEQERLFAAALYFCFVMVAANAVMFTVSFLHQRIWALWQRRLWRKERGEKLLIIGNNDGSRRIYASECRRMKAILAPLTKEEQSDLFMKGIRFLTDGKKQSMCLKLLDQCLNPQQNSSCIIVINTEDDEANLALGYRIVKHTENTIKSRRPEEIAELLARVRVYAFGHPDHEELYHELEKESKGIVRHINKYRRIAMDFVEQYPLTQFMTEKQLDTENFVVRDGVGINMLMIGFGKTNRQIFMTSLANNQFLRMANGERVLQQVNYHIFDKERPENNKNLNHSYARFKNELGDIIKAEAALPKEQQRYLPFPEMPALEHSHPLDINDPDFYKTVRGILTAEGAYNYIVIAFGTDMENVDMANKLIEKKDEWGAHQTRLFVKVRNGSRFFPIFKRNDCFMIGDEARVVYSIGHIDDNELIKMAMKRNRTYAIEKNRVKAAKAQAAGEPMAPLTKEEVAEICALADYEWYNEKTPFERESNLYACLSLRSKLHMMGLDAVPGDIQTSGALQDNDAYWSVYAAGDLPALLPGLTVDGKAVVDPYVAHPESRRTTMAIQEHYRWNAFMISKGFVPADKNTILTAPKNGKDYHIRRHGNLTTFEGLVDFRRLLAARDGDDEMSHDVIKYDYQLLDDAYWLLSKHGFAVIRREENAVAD